MRAKRCAALTKAGTPCQMPIVGGSEFCVTHSPEHAAQLADARRRGGKNRRRPLGSGPTVVLRDVAAVRALLETTISDELLLENSHPRNRTLGTLLGVALETLKVGGLEDRLAALEVHMNRTRRRA